MEVESSFCHGPPREETNDDDNDRYYISPDMLSMIGARRKKEKNKDDCINQSQDSSLSEFDPFLYKWEKFPEKLNPLFFPCVTQ